jgi:hypothetical protein
VFATGLITILSITLVGIPVCRFTRRPISVSGCAIVDEQI